MLSSQRPVLTSLTRISDLAERAFDVSPLPKDEWETGNYVVGEVTSRRNVGVLVELANGRMIEVACGDLLIGALGTRAATLEAVGSWQDIEEDGRMQSLTAAGLIGKVTSISPYLRSLLELQYRGHVMRDQSAVSMNDFVEHTPAQYNCPTILIIGTSMSSGKTTAGKVIVRLLSRMGLRVAAVKLTGAGRFRDTLSMQDAGAHFIYDFVDAGLPSTVCSKPTYRRAIRTVLGRISEQTPDVVVAEAGASPLEPYNGDTLIEEIREQIGFTVLCASDPYAVVGVTQGFGFNPNVVAGVATSTSAGVEVVKKLTGFSALNLLDPESHAELATLLQQQLGLSSDSSETR